MIRALRRVALARATLAMVHGEGPMVLMIGSAPTRRRIGAACCSVPWSIGAGLFEVVLFARAVRPVGSRSLPAPRDCVLCGLCGLRLGDDSIAGHPFESLDADTGVCSWA